MTRIRLNLGEDAFIDVTLEGIPSVGDTFISSTGTRYLVTSKPVWLKYISPELGKRPNVQFDARELE